MRFRAQTHDSIASLPPLSLHCVRKFTAGLGPGSFGSHAEFRDDSGSNFPFIGVGCMHDMQRSYIKDLASANAISKLSQADLNSHSPLCSTQTS